jgi:nucleoredoxin
MDARKLRSSKNVPWIRFLPFILLLLPPLHAGEPLTIESLAASRALWPREVTVNVAHQVPLLVNGKLSGSMQAPPGRIYAVKSVESVGVIVDAMGSPLTFPAADTDILARAEAVKERLETLAAARAAPTPSTSESPAQTAPTPAPTASANKVAARLSGKLVRHDGSRLEQFDASTLKEKKYLAVYFSASWCGPCKQFTPKLVEWYQQQKSYLDKFDVIFVSRDNSKEEMLNYMKQDGMPWPALSFSKANRDSSPLEKYAGRGIPCLVVIDGEGKVISHSYKEEQYIGPSKVMKDLEGLLTAQ